MPQSAKVAERLRAHARLCRQIALESACEKTRLESEQMASDCDEAVAEMRGLKHDVQPVLTGGARVPTA